MRNVAGVALLSLFFYACGTDSAPEERWHAPEFCDCVYHMSEIFEGEREAKYDGAYAIIYENENKADMDSCVKIFAREVDACNTAFPGDADGSTNAMVRKLEKCKDGDRYMREYAAMLQHQKAQLDTLDAGSKQQMEEIEILLKHYAKKPE